MRQQRTSGNHSSQAANGRRMRATPRLREVIEQQGRRHGWVAQKVDVSRAQLSRVLSGTRGIAESDARVLAALLGEDVALLFVLSDERKRLPNGRFDRQGYVDGA